MTEAFTQPCLRAQNGEPECTIENAIDYTACGACVWKWNPHTVRRRRSRARMTREERNAKDREAVARRRVALVKLLSPDGKCAKCGETFAHEDLTIEHVDGIGWNHDSVSSSTRVSRYWREYREGIALEAQCNPCNVSSSEYHKRRKAAARGGE